MSRMTRRAAAAAGVLALATGCAAAPMAASASASPGQLTVDTCRSSSGTPISGGPWTQSSSMSDNCAGGGELTLRLPYSGVGTTVSTSIGAPTGLSILQARLWRRYDMAVSASGSQPQLQSSWENGGRFYAGTSAYGGYLGDSQNNPYNASAPNNYLSVGGPRSSVAAQINCVEAGPSPQVCDSGATWTVHKLDLVLSDDTSPSFSQPMSGDLLDGSWHTGSTATVSFRASDIGSGVYRAWIRKADGTTVYASVDPANARCQSSNPSNPYEFDAASTTLVPCKTAESAYTASFDLTKVGDGTFGAVSVGVEDASGREATSATGQTLRVNAPGGAYGDPGTTGPGGCVYQDDGTCAVPPTAATAPVVNGTPQVDKTLTSTNGTWTNASGATYTIQWQRSTPGGGFDDIIGATGSTYRITSADVGHTLRSKVTANTASGSTSTTSAPTATVTDVPDSSTSDNGTGQAPSSGGGGGSGGGAGSAAPAGCADKTKVGNACSPGTSDRSPEPVPANQPGPTRGAWIGSNATDDARLKVVFDQSKRDTLHTRFGKRASLTGRLVNADNARPITGATVHISGIRSTRSTAEHVVVKTDLEGSFHLQLPTGLTSQTLRIAYRSHEQDKDPVAAESLRLKVDAAATLRVSPKKVTRRARNRRRRITRMLRNGDRVTFRGRVRTGPIPVGGKTIILEAKVRGLKGWRQFKTMRTARDGSFTYRYRLHDTVGRVKYTFRVVVPAVEGSGVDYPYENGHSATTHIMVRGR